MKVSLVILCCSLSYSSFSQKCNCKEFPIEQRCKKECGISLLKFGTPEELENEFKLDHETIKEILRVPYRESGTMGDFKRYMPPKNFEKLRSKISTWENTVTYESNGTGNMDNHVGTVSGSVVNGTQVNGTQVNGTQVNIYGDTTRHNSSDLGNSSYDFSQFSETIGGSVKVTLTRCELKNYILTCYAIYENVSTNPSIQISYQTGGGSVIDEDGNIYHSTNATIANIQSEKYSTLKYSLIKGVRAKVIIQFPVGRSDLKKLRSVEVATGYPFYDVPVIH